ncbi:hypothetical protein FA13DRAFT_207127 [Coprinellus micaceus]|uniref:Uncharacterized protein n=1 Tax=Coprinellus micaceus TaxID=71717 RepID=A0A4Y7SFJ3_COPMI|nr:hypothetical protein FA13DRAFT_207127 [Coprinellus micaceus]
MCRSPCVEDIRQGVDSLTNSGTKFETIPLLGSIIIRRSSCPSLALGHHCASNSTTRRASQVTRPCPGPCPPAMSNKGPLFVITLRKTEPGMDKRLVFSAPLSLRSPFTLNRERFA